MTCEDLQVDGEQDDGVRMMNGYHDLSVNKSSRCVIYSFVRLQFCSLFVLRATQSRDFLLGLIGFANRAPAGWMPVAECL